MAVRSDGAPMMDWQVANTVMTSDTFCSTYCKGCAPSVTPASRWTPALRDDCVRAIETIANTSARGQISQSHAMGPMEDVAQREWGIACFLIGAGRLSFYSYANWAKDSWTTAVRPALPAEACLLHSTSRVSVAVCPRLGWACATGHTLVAGVRTEDRRAARPTTHQSSRLGSLCLHSEVQLRDNRARGYREARGEDSVGIGRTAQAKRLPNTAYM